MLSTLSSFLLGRMPTISMGMSMPTWHPDRRIMRSARSMIRTGTPISSMKTAAVGEAEDWRTSCTASSTLMKNRVMRGR